MVCLNEATVYNRSANLTARISGRYNECSFLFNKCSAMDLLQKTQHLKTTFEPSCKL